MVFVDRLVDWGWRLGPSCHLIADTEEELHEFAARLGMKRGWAQVSRSGIPHYDLTISRREAAISLGAVDCREMEGMRKFVAVSKEWARKASGESLNLKSNCHGEGKGS